MSASDNYIAEVKARLLDIYNALQSHTRLTDDDRMSTCWQNVATCVDLLWEYRAVNPRFPSGAEAWYEKDLATRAVLEIIRDQVKPLLAAAEKDMGRFNAHVQEQLVGLRSYVEAGWRPVQRKGPVPQEGRMEEIEHMQTLLRRLEVLK